MINRILDFILCVIFLLALSAGRPLFDPGLYLGSENAGVAGVYFYTQQTLIILLVAICYLSLQPKRWYRSTWTLAPYMMFIVLSLIGTVDINTSVNHFLRLVTILIGIDGYIRIRGPHKMLQVLVVSLLLVNIFSIIAVFAYPAIGKHSADEGVFLANAGNWRGITSQKNVLGRVAAINAVLLICYWDIIGWRRSISYGLALICLANVFGSQSATGIIILFACLSFYFVVARKRRNALLEFAWVGGTILLIGALVMSPELFLKLLGKDMSGSGRADIWAFSWNVIRGEPIFGYGFDAGASHFRPVMQKLIFPSAVDAHNAYLQCIIDLGWGGLAALLFAIIAAMSKAFRRLPANDNMTRGANSALGVIIVSAIVAGVSEISPFSLTSDVGFMTFIALAGISTTRRSAASAPEDATSQITAIRPLPHLDAAMVSSMAPKN